MTTADGFCEDCKHSKVGAGLRLLCCRQKSEFTAPEKPYGHSCKHWEGKPGVKPRINAQLEDEDATESSLFSLH